MTIICPHCGGSFTHYNSATRQAVIALFLEGKNQTEIAAAIGRTPSAVRSHLISHARKVTGLTRKDRPGFQTPQEQDAWREIFRKHQE